MPHHDPTREHALMMTRRQLFGKAALGLGTAALASLTGPKLFADPLSTGSSTSSIVPKAKRVIYLFMMGGPSQHDLWDYKPKLKDLFDQDIPEEITRGQRVTTMTSNQSRFPIAPSKYNFSKYDNHDQGVWISELLPHTASVAKDLCVVHSTFTEAINHDPAVTYIQTGSQFAGRPSMGAWLSYGLGSLSDNLPAYVVMHAKNTSNNGVQPIFARLWGTAFMPSQHQGVSLRSAKDPILYLNNPQGITTHDRRAQLDALAALNQHMHDEFANPEIIAQIEQHELAYRLQSAVPELTDWSDEREDTFELYGEDSRTPGTFAACCLQARRLAERGTRCIQIFHRGWDQHRALPTALPVNCKDIDQACAGLIKDLKRRGMLDDTLVIWGGEFGRTTYCQGPLNNKTYGRDHHPRCFTVWMAGGGVKPGITFGKTDEYGYNILDTAGNISDPTPHHHNPGAMHIHDLNATILHQLGIDHKKLSYRYQGRDFTLTDIHGHVMHELLA